METVNDYCQNRLLIAGSKHELKQFERTADWTDIPGATDFAMQQHEPTRIVWLFVTNSPALSALRVLSGRWPRLTFFLHYDCEDSRIIGLIRAKDGRLRHHRFEC
jgi:hypothetical protein